MSGVPNLRPQLTLCQRLASCQDRNEGNLLKIYGNLLNMPGNQFTYYLLTFGKNLLNCYSYQLLI